MQRRTLIAGLGWGWGVTINNNKGRRHNNNRPTIQIYKTCQKERFSDLAFRDILEFGGENANVCVSTVEGEGPGDGRVVTLVLRSESNCCGNRLTSKYLICIWSVSSLKCWWCLHTYRLFNKTEQTKHQHHPAPYNKRTILLDVMLGQNAGSF